jgi:hypothetical protein
VRIIEMDELETFVGGIKKLESLLIKFVLSSFAFSLLAVIAQYDKFDLAFQSLTELLAGITGSAGVLSAFLGRYSHPSEKALDYLEYRPDFAGPRITASLIFSAAMFFVFYLFASESNKLGLLFFCIGTFLFFNSLAVALRTMEKIELQKRIWAALSPQERADWREVQNKVREEQTKTIENLRSAVRDLEEVQAANARYLNRVRITKEEATRKERREKFQKVISTPWRATRPLRKRIGGQKLLTRAERIEEAKYEAASESFLKQFEVGREHHTKNIAAIKQKEVRSNPLESTDIELYRVGGFIYFFPKEDIDASSAGEYLGRLTSLKPDKDGMPNRFVAVLPPSITVTNDARELLREANIELHEIDEDMAVEPH